MLKNTIRIALVLVLTIALAACGRDVSVEKVENIENVENVEKVENVVVTEHEPEQKPIEEKKTGVLIEASMHVITIQAPDGTSYTFGIDDNTKIVGSEILGNTLEVVFMGEYANDIVAISVTTIKEAEHKSGSPAKGKTDGTTAPKPKKDPPKTDDPVSYITGTVTDASMNSIQVLYSDGNTYTIKKDDNTVVDPGIVVGCVARVFHKGGLKNGMLATEIHLIADAPAPGETSQAMTGTVVDSSNANITILGGDQVQYTFLKTDDTVIDGSGITDLDNNVKITYTGDVTDNPTATKIEAAG